MNATWCLTCHNVPVSPFQSAGIVGIHNKQTGRLLFPALPNWTVWPGSQLKPEVRSSIFLPPRHIAMTTDIEITLSPGKKAWVTPHSGPFVVHEESRVHLGEPVKDEYSASWRGKIRLDIERGGRKEGLGERAVMRLQPLNSPTGKRKVTDSFIPKIANKLAKNKGLSEGLQKHVKCMFYLPFHSKVSLKLSYNSLHLSKVV